MCDGPDEIIKRDDGDGIEVVAGPDSRWRIRRLKAKLWITQPRWMWRLRKSRNDIP